LALHLHRRAFLRAAAGLTGSLALRSSHALKAAPTTELVIGACQTKSLETGKLGLALLAIDPMGKQQLEIPLEFHFHGFVPNPKVPARAILFEKHGPGACEVDLAAGKVLRAITPSADRSFYGHGAYTADGGVLYATETRRDGTGLITIRDGRTFALIGELPTFGARPHDCRLIDGGATLVVTNGGGKLDDAEPAPSVTYIDLRAQKLIERLEFSTSRINAGHLDIGPRGELAIVSAPRRGLPVSEHGGLTIRNADKRFVTVTEPAATTGKMVGEVLSVCIHGASGVVGVTTPDGNLLSFWDMKTRRLLKHVDVDSPRGIALTADERHFVVSCGKLPHLDYYKTEGLTLDPKKTAADVRLTGSHIYTHRLPRAS